MLTNSGCGIGCTKQSGLPGWGGEGEGGISEPHCRELHHTRAAMVVCFLLRGIPDRLKTMALRRACWSLDMGPKRLCLFFIEREKVVNASSGCDTGRTRCPGLLRSG